MNLNYFILLTVFIITLLIRTNVHCSDFENLSYGQDVLSGKAPATEAPPETTTKKKGFFSGIKKLFGGGKTTTTELNILASSTTPNPAILSTSTSTQKPNQNRDIPTPTPKSVASSSITSSSTSTTTTTKSPDNRRDFVAPVRPNSSGSIGGTGGISPIAGSTTTTTTPRPDNRRDFVAPVRPNPPGSIGGTVGNHEFTSSTTITLKPGQPPRSPLPANPQNIPAGSLSTSTTTTARPDNRRDYVAPIRPSTPPAIPPRASSPSVIPPRPPSPGGFNNIPGSPTPSSNRRDYVNPNIPSQTPPPVPPRPGSPNILNEKDFPPLGPTRGGNQRPSQGTVSPAPPSPGSPGGNRVNFVPHAPGTPTRASTTKTQLAKDDELSTLTENLLTKDVNNQNEHITVNLQGKTKSTERTDEAPESLLDVKDEALNSPTIAKMRLLYNNYEIDTSINEYVTPIEHKEENDFVDAIMATTVMRTAMQFLQNKGIVTPDPKTHRDYVKTLWFTLYSRGGGRIGSSAFEHVFLNEIKNGTVIGMHNWVYYFEEEKLGHADYKGYIRKVDLGTKGTILKYRFNYNGLEKYANTLFIGTSPELEMALYTVCFAVRADQDCPISLNQQKLNIVTHTWKYRGKQLIGSAYPEI